MYNSSKTENIKYRCLKCPIIISDRRALINHLFNCKNLQRTKLIYSCKYFFGHLFDNLQERNQHQIICDKVQIGEYIVVLNDLNSF